MSMRSSFLTLALVSLLFSCETKNTFDQPEVNYFLKYYGNEGNQAGVDFVVNPDGTFILLGNSRTTPSSDQQIYVAKADANGKVIWEKTFGGRYDEEAKDMELLSDGNLIVLANSEVALGTDRDVLLIRLNQDGLKLDSVRQGLGSLSFPTDDNANSISVISDGYIVAGSTSSIPTPAVDKSDFMYMRFRNNFTFIKGTDPEAWKSSPINGYPGEDVAVKLIQFNPTTFYLMGYSNVDQNNTNAVVDFNFIFQKLGPTGENSSGLLFAGSPSFDEKLNSVSLSPAQSGLGYLLSGISQNTTDGDVYLVRLTQQLSFTSSDLSINKSLGFSLGKSALPNSFNTASLTSGYYVTTEIINGTTTDIYLIKRDNRGGKIFEQVFGGIGDDFAGAVAELPNGHIVMIGTMTLGGVVDGQRKIVFMKLNPEGKLAP